MKPMTKNGRVALVTGANKGIGREIAKGLAQLGFTVLASARDRQRGAQTVAELADDGLDVRFQLLDVTDESSVDAAADQVAAEFGCLDVLVNNAAIANELEVPPSLTLVDDMRRVFETNVFGVVAMTNAVLPLLRKSDAARIVNVSSRLGSLSHMAATDSPFGLHMAYSSSKSALNAVTVHYARELADTQIKVNACTPGYVATDLNGNRGLRTPAQGAKIAVELAVLASDGPTGGFFDDNGPVSW
ncbi:short-chain dehydrogenase [Kutzneria sp. 744]|nr:short-chain dehydrogenase [Kutzneria sp. 744]